MTTNHIIRIFFVKLFSVHLNKNIFAQLNRSRAKWFSVKVELQPNVLCHPNRRHFKCTQITNWTTLTGWFFAYCAWLLVTDGSNIYSHRNGQADYYYHQRSRFSFCCLRNEKKNRLGYWFCCKWCCAYHSLNFISCEINLMILN